MHNERTSRIADVIRARRTVRQFLERPIAHDLLLELMDVANWAPNHGLREPWRFVLYRGAARGELAEAVVAAMSPDDRVKYGEQRRAYLLGIPAHLIVIMQEDSRQKQWDENFAAVSAWIQTFQLAAWDEGIGVVWKTNPYMYDPSFRTAVGAAGGEKIVGVLHVGYPAAVPEPRPRTPAASLLTIRE